MPRFIAPSIAGVCLIVAAGCGSSSSGGAAVATPTPLTKAAYTKDLHNVAQEENRAQQTVSAAFHAKTVGKIRAALSAFADDQRQAAAQLDSLTPPADAVTPNAALAKAFSDNAAAITALLTQLAHTTDVKQALHMIQTDPAAQRVGREIDAALKQLKRLGYTTGS